jgi:phospholipid/cholesterol/gamma-HCH transport system permease protein
MADVKQVYQRPLAAVDRLGEQLAFYIRALIASPRSVKRYPREILRILAEVALGSGALAVIGGTVGVILVMTFFTGAQVGLSG